MAKKNNLPEPTDLKQGLLSNLKITRNGALEIGILAIIILICIVMRILPMQWGPYLNEYDPFFHYRSAEYIAKNGYAAWYTWVDDLSWYPMGRDVASNAYPGIPFSGVFLWQVANTVGIKIDVLTACLYFPVLMAAITCVFAFLLGKDFAGGVGGIFTALLVAINPSYISRTVAGFFDTENIGIFAIATTSLFFIRSIDDKRGIPSRIMYAIIGGLTFGYLSASWGAARYITGLLSVFLIVSILIGKYKTQQLTSFSIINGLGLLIAAIFVPHLGWGYLSSIENLAALSVAIVALIYEFLKTRVDDEKLRIGMLVSFLIIGLAVFILPIFGIGNGIGGKFLRVLDPFESPNALFSSVGEHKLSTWNNFFEDWGVGLALGLLGAYYIIKDLDDKKLYLLLFYLTALYFSATLVRILLIFAIPGSILVSYAIVELLAPFNAGISAPKEVGKRKRSIFAVSKPLSIVFILMLFLSFVIPVLDAQAIANQPGPYASSMIPVLLNGDFPNDWHTALAWLKANTTKDAVIATWWDYGYWIETVANRTTIIDGSTQTPYPIETMGKIMMSPQNSSLPLLKNLGADYILVFNTYNPNTLTEWSFGLNARWEAMTQIAGIPLTKFIGYNTTSSQYYLTSAYWNCTYAKLSYYQNTLITSGTDGVPKIALNDHFKLVYHSKYDFVLIYKIIY